MEQIQVGTAALEGFAPGRYVLCEPTDLPGLDLLPTEGLVNTFAALVEDVRCLFWRARFPGAYYGVDRLATQSGQPPVSTKSGQLLVKYSVLALVPFGDGSQLAHKLAAMVADKTGILVDATSWSGDLKISIVDDTFYVGGPVAYTIELDRHSFVLAQSGVDGTSFTQLTIELAPCQLLALGKSVWDDIYCFRNAFGHHFTAYSRFDDSDHFQAPWTSTRPILFHIGSSERGRPYAVEFKAWLEQLPPPTNAP